MNTIPSLPPTSKETSSTFAEAFAEIAATVADLCEENARLQERLDKLEAQQSSHPPPQTNYDAADDAAQSFPGGEHLEDRAENIADGFVALDREWRYVDLNDENARFTGRSRAEMLGRSMWELFPHAVDTPFFALCHRVMKNRVAARLEGYEPLRKHWFEASIYPSEAGISIYFRNVDARHHETERRRQVLARLFEVQEQERSRLAHQLQEELGQSLATLKMGLDALPDFPNEGHASPTANRRIVQLQTLTDELAQRVHVLAWAMRPSALDDLSLEAALERLAAQWAEQNNISLDFYAHGFENALLPIELRTTLYRVVQEVLLNAERHAGARRLSLILEYRDDDVSATLEDDGCGFDVGQCLNNHCTGLASMRERVAMAGGTLQIEAEPGCGTTVFVRLRVPRAKVATTL